MPDPQNWYIVKKNDGSCEISNIATAIAPDRTETKEEKREKKIWGPFGDRQEAIARRVGLIRAGKCQPKLQ